MKTGRTLLLYVKSVIDFLLHNVSIINIEYTQHIVSIVFYKLIYVQYHIHRLVVVRNY